MQAGIEHFYIIFKANGGVKVKTFYP